MRSIWVGTAVMALASASAAHADQRPLNDSSPNLVDAAKTPLNDLNIEKRDIPEVLSAAISNPYSMDGVKSCGSIMLEVQKLDEILGPDLEMPQDENPRISTGRVAKWMVSRFIPFRSLIREISGANAQDQQVRIAVQAGVARRSFLKGMGQTKGCKYPARPATEKMIAERKAEILAAKNDDRQEKTEGKAVDVSDDAKTKPKEVAKAN